jgi:putative nucleotidyltransferase with HDIG domain
VGAALAAVAHFLVLRYGWSTGTLVLPVAYTIYRAYNAQMARIRDQAQHIAEMEALHLRTMEGLAMAIEAKDQDTHNHLLRVRVYVTEIGKALQLIDAEMEAVKTAALLHDIGKLAVPERIINKPGKLTQEEFETMKIHPAVGGHSGARAFPLSGGADLAVAPRVVERDGLSGRAAGGGHSDRRSHSDRGLQLRRDGVGPALPAGHAARCCWCCWLRPERWRWSAMLRATLPTAASWTRSSGGNARGARRAACGGPIRGCDGPDGCSWLTGCMGSLARRGSMTLLGGSWLSHAWLCARNLANHAWLGGAVELGAKE